MIVASEFPGDDNETLKRVQHALYGQMLICLFLSPCDGYLAACRLTGSDTEIGTRVRAMTGFDHRTLQSAHDQIAAWYRFSVDDGGQLRLGESALAFEARLSAEWRDFFRREIEALAESDEFTRDILAAAVFANSDRGLAAEAGVREFLKERYARMHSARGAAQGQGAAR